MPFKFGPRSVSLMGEGLNPDLVRCNYYAIEVTEQDFCVWEVARTVERQADLVAAKASRTMDSHHIPHPVTKRVDAEDLVPWIGGGPRWIAQPGLLVAKAMHRAATKFDVPITWGGVWDRDFRALDATDLDGEVESYVQRFRARKGRKPLVDIWHFQVPRQP